jgi:hypothetical protein
LPSRCGRFSIRATKAKSPCSRCAEHPPVALQVP